MRKDIPYFLSAFLILVCLSSCASKPKPGTDSVVSENTDFENALSVDAAGRTIAQINSNYPDTIILEKSQPHKIKWGDTLSKLAIRNWGKSNGYYFPLIILASGNVITDPDLIIPNRILTIPNLSANLNNAATRAKLNAYINEIADWYEREHPAAKSIINGLRNIAK